MKKILELFITFFRIGLFTFGGGYAMISVVKEEVVEKKKWLTSDEFYEIIAIAESTPGPIAVNMATYVGYKRKGFFGSLFSTIGLVLPSLIIIFIISLFLDEFLENKYVFNAFKGIKCCVAFLIIKAGIDMLIKLKKNAYSIIVFSLVFIAVILISIFSVNFSTIYLIVIGGLLGFFLFGFRNAKGEAANNPNEILSNEDVLPAKNESVEKVENTSNQESEGDTK